MLKVLISICGINFEYLFPIVSVFKFCPRGYTARFKSSCYKFATARTSWINALLECRMDGSDLVAIESAAENNYIRKYIEERPYLNNTGNRKDI